MTQQLAATQMVAQMFTAAAGVVHDFQEKVRHFKEIDQKYADVLGQNALLKQELATLRFEQQAQKQALETQRVAKKLVTDTGTRFGRAPASLNYSIPKELTAHQLHILALSYMEGQEDEKAAVILNSLISSDETFRTPQDWLMMGVLWFRLDNLPLAGQSFNHVLSFPEADESIRYQAQARLWMALVEHRMNKDERSQDWLKDLMDHHPHSQEVTWINPDRGGK